MDQEKLETIKKSLQSIGFSLEEVEKQIEEVGKIVIMAILHRLLKEKAALEELTPKNIKNYLKDNFTAEYIQEVIDIESDKIVNDYLKAVTRDLSEEEKGKVF